MSLHTYTHHQHTQLQHYSIIRCFILGLFLTLSTMLAPSSFPTTFPRSYFFPSCFQQPTRKALAMLPLSCKYFLSLPRTQLVCIAIHIWHTHTHTLSLFFFLSFFATATKKKKKSYFLLLFSMLHIYTQHPLFLPTSSIINCPCPTRSIQIIF